MSFLFACKSTKKNRMTKWLQAVKKGYVQGLKACKSCYSELLLLPLLRISEKPKHLSV